MYTLLSYSPTDGTCDSRLISETTLPATTTTEVSTTPRTCPPDFVTLNGGCYKYHQEKKTWMEAKTTCESESDHLVALTSLQEQNQIAIAIYGIRGAGVTFHGGGNDMDSDGIWEWPDGQPFDFSYWEGAVPTGGCLVVPVYPGKWTTGNCASDMREFMCEIDM
ncbi:C-type lectin domain family 17, member A-like [Liolophura sinensis]|uniref:C-type lectin domain family 17, member A-like n=1 Tax=Liolophura sinensis TaxID=3198878 RepID=UPI0031597381